MEYKSIKVGVNEIKIPIPTSYRDCFVLIQSDYYRYVGKVVPVWKIWLKSFMSISASFHLWFRFAQYRKGLFYYYSMWRYRRISNRLGLQISPRINVGAGFYIGHFFGTIVNPTAIIGNNVNLSQFTTIGSNKGRAAIIGDNVYVGPSVCLVEEVCVCCNSSIGAGAVVVKDVPENATVAGVPARVLNYDNPGRFVNRRWDISSMK